MAARSPWPLFFIHIMKTGGHTLHYMLSPALRADQLYPDPKVQPEGRPHRDNRHPDGLRLLSSDDLDRIQLYSGHLPFYATTLVPRPLTTITLLRHPVARTISHLKQIERLDSRHHGRAIEEIYDDWSLQLSTLANHQCKVFSATPEDGAGTIFDIIEIDDLRLERAIENLRTVDLVGITEDYERFRHRLGELLSLDLPSAKAYASPGGETVSEAFRRRIAVDNAADMELYEVARELASGSVSPAAAPIVPT